MKNFYLALACASCLALICACTPKPVSDEVDVVLPAPRVETPAATPGAVQEAAPAPAVIDADYSAFFGDLDGTVVLYTPALDTYEIYNAAGAERRRSPCSTFKIVSTLVALERGVITPEDSFREWSGERFWKKDWNQDMKIHGAFRSSCVWYFRMIIDEIGEAQMQGALDNLSYGNRDISDWSGRLNKNNSNPALTGFWVESSLKISPKEQTEVLARIFDPGAPFDPENIALLKEVMEADQDKTERAIYGKTGYGKLGDTSLDSWYTGFFEDRGTPTYFAVHIGDSDDPAVSSALAKSIAIDIIASLP